MGSTAIRRITSTRATSVFPYKVGTSVSNISTHPRPGDVVRHIRAVDVVRHTPTVGSHDGLVPGLGAANGLMYGISQQRAYGTSWNKRIEKQEKLSETVFQYAGKNSKRADRVYVWGYAATGALGVEKFLKPRKRQKPRMFQMVPHRLNFMDEHDLTVTDVGCGYGYTVYLCSSDSKRFVYGTGINTDSQLGFHEYPRRSGRVLDFVVEPVPIQLPLVESDRTKLLQVACGRAHTLIRTDKEGIFSLGNNTHGQCGRPIVEGEEFRGSQVISKVQLEQPVRHVECGQDHSLFVTEDGEVYSCGLGADGQTGLGHLEAVGIPTKVTGDIVGEKIVQVSSKADCILAVSEKGDVFGWGNSEYNQLACVEPDSTCVSVARRLPFSDDVGKVVKVAAAGSICALVNDAGQVYVWGYGILGKGPQLEETTAPSLIPATLFGGNQFSPDLKVVDIKCGINYFATVTSQGDLYMWGKNKTACLGLGSTKDQFFPLKTQVPAEVKTVACGVDHTVVLCKAFA